MDSEHQTTQWAQRLLRSKLHLPFHTVEVRTGADGQIDYSASLDTLTSHPLCGRQLNNHREERAQQADKIEFATSLGEFTYQLMSGKACRHCGAKAGILVRTRKEMAEEGEQE